MFCGFVLHKVPTFLAGATALKHILISTALEYSPIVRLLSSTTGRKSYDLSFQCTLLQAYRQSDSTSFPSMSSCFVADW